MVHFPAMRLPSAFSVVTALSSGLLALSLSGCVGGPYPADASAFRWEKSAERVREQKTAVLVAGLSQSGSADLRYMQSGGGGMSCSIPLELRREVRQEIDWTLVESIESFGSGPSEVTTSFPFQADAGARAPEDGVPAEAMKSKPASGQLRVDESATFRDHPVLVNWRVSSKSGAAIAEGERRVANGSGAADCEIKLTREQLERIVGDPAGGAFTEIKVAFDPPVGSSAPVQVRSRSALTPAMVKQSLPGVRWPRVYDFVAVLVSEPSRNGEGSGVVFNITCDVSADGAKVAEDEVFIEWRLEPESGSESSRPLSGQSSMAMRAGRISLEIPADSCRKWLAQWPERDRDGNNLPQNREKVLRLVGTARIGGASSGFRSVFTRSDLAAILGGTPLKSGSDGASAEGPRS